MIYSVLVKSSLFFGVSEKEIEKILENIPYHLQTYEKGETILHLMENALNIGIVLEGKVQAQKLFPNGSQINVSFRGPGDIIGAAAVFSNSQKYPCDIVALEHVTIMMFHKEDILLLLQRNIKILNNFINNLGTSTYMLQQRLELLSYSGISQKIACYLLIQNRQTGQNKIQIPKSVSNWAMIMNVSRSSLHRELKKLEVNGILSYQPPFIEILDWEELETVLNN
ncbi:MAG: Crp/Fnr family transcriptional regulator [Faecalicoccus sp.]|nr:Crp/Fnr family transcriptional regulator [Faecalicoccus sp.]